MDVKTAATGRWKEILTASGIESNSLTGDHGPCPKCGGRDRFRFTDQDGNGSVICSGGGQDCAKTSDGFETLKWYAGFSFSESLRFVAELLGVPESTKRQPKQLIEICEPTGDPIADGLMALFCGFNKGILPLGVARAGGCMARHYSQSVIAIPAVDESLEVITNYVMMSPTSRHLWHRDKTGQDVRIRKKTAMQGAGILGGESLEFIRAGGYVDVCWKVEGPTSMMALQSVIGEAWGKHVVVSNVHGADERPSWMAEALASRCKAVYIVADCDDAGRRGAQKWADAVSLAGGTAKVIKLPYDDDSKKDLRDFVQEHGTATLGMLMSIAEQTKQVEAPARVIVEANRDIPQSDRVVLEDLALDVLYEDERERLIVYSRETRKICTVSQIDKLKYEKLLQMAGVVVKSTVVQGEEAHPGQHTMPTVRKALAVAGSCRRMSESEAELRGPGIWAGHDYEGNDTGRVVCCNKSGVSVYDENGVWSQVESPRVDGLLFDLGRFRWFEHDELAPVIEQAKDPQWCAQSLGQLERYLDRWSWARQDTDPTLLTGLVAATFCQAVWKWRPQVSLRGKSNAGKTSLLKLLFGAPEIGEAGIFGALSFCRAHSSAAGIRQSVRKTGYAIGLDEWDGLKGRHKAEILQMLRTAGPGSQLAMGTASQRAMEFGLRHICWIAGIHCGLSEEADANRFIEFELTMANQEKRKAWEMPSHEERMQVRRNLTAIAIVHCLRAAKMANEIRRQVNLRLDERQITSLCVPASILATATGATDQEAVQMAEMLGMGMQDDQDEIEATETRLLREIFELAVVTSSNHYTAAEVLSLSADYTDASMADQIAKQLGVGVHYYQGDKRCAAIYPTKVANRMPKSEMSRKDIQQVLMRIPGAFRHSVKLGGSAAKCVLIPWSKVEQVVYESDEASVTKSL